MLNGDWGLTENAFSGLYALTDSPDGDYQEAQQTIAQLTTDINFQFVSNPFIKFNAKWDIEPNYDFIRFQALIADSGWITLSGEYTEAGSGQPAQPFGEHGYDDLQEDWVEETIHLDYLDGIVVKDSALSKPQIILLKVMVFLLITSKFWAIPPG